jgi:hypothetical protein
MERFFIFQEAARPGMAIPGVSLSFGAPGLACGGRLGCAMARRPSRSVRLSLGKKL